MLGAMKANIVPCTRWPIDPIDPQVRIGDRAGRTSSWCSEATLVRGLERALSSRAATITTGVYIYGENRCANDAVTGFLTTAA
ncbi:hypothetical protein AB0I52_32530 [Streptomyces sp. NPDC050423]|uniref:hypothetical protein n=1 Tax=Streptomyces sp. NPDC050423 TaxID=3155402 RepID=UPI003425A2FF